MARRSAVILRDEAAPSTADAYRIPQQDVGTLVIFGATGDLARRKLIPAIYNLWTAGFLPQDIAVLGVARRDVGETRFREDMCEALKAHSRTGHGDSEACDPFVRNIHYQPLQFDDDSGYAALSERLEEIESERKLPGHRLFYLATAPDSFAPIVEQLRAAGMVRAMGEERWSRVVVEKPFGHDLASARALNARLLGVLHEDQIYRIDHYLGKETVQNIFAFRFGNSVFEPLFNRKYVDHVQITMAETVGMEGRRGAFYDGAGALRDVLQNHLLQLLALIAMEPPASFNAKEIRDEKVKVLTSVGLPKGDPLPTWLVRGQYGAAADAPGYLEEEGVASGSTTETYVALRCHVDNWRWAGVPFYVRTGKRLEKRVTEIAVQFRRPPLHFFERLGVMRPEANTLVFRIQPDEAISLRLSTKPPGMAFDIRPVDMDFVYDATFHEELPDAYERLILDALRGDSTLFMRADEIESAWRIATDILEVWRDAPPPETYAPLTWGPDSAACLFDGCEGAWRSP
jgi:glucose-6-phosphate 1-dehydrogenase